MSLSVLGCSLWASPRYARNLRFQIQIYYLNLPSEVPQAFSWLTTDVACTRVNPLLGLTSLGVPRSLRN